MNYIYLSVNVPAEMEKSPKFMEQFYTSLWGMQSSGSWSEKFWDGRQQVYLSFELVGISGSMRFIIRTPAQFRDLVEAQLYSEYPEAEVTEVEDYAQNLTWEKASRDYDTFGAEMELSKPDAYPIRTYMEFEHSLTQQILDPISNFAETFTQLQPDEQVWVQILAAPMPPGDKWMTEGGDLVKKLMHRKEEDAKIIPEIPILNQFLGDTTSVISQAPGAMFEVPVASRQDVPPEFRELFITSPGERTDLEALERNMSKVGFSVKIRWIYIAPKEASRKEAIVSAVFGLWNQYGTQNLNGIKPNKKFWTKVDYFLPKTRVKSRMNKVFWRYQDRDYRMGGKPFILTTEEMATIFHFPSITVQAPQLERIESKKGEPPANLPVV
ncbi:hypothetical protein ACFL2D_03145 [Patescibacteria group bacterium]